MPRNGSILLTRGSSWEKPVNAIANAKFYSEIFPNPAENFVTINAKQNINSVKILNQIGQQVYGISNINDLRTTIYLSNLKAGLYILSVEYTDGSIEKTKLIKR